MRAHVLADFGSTFTKLTVVEAGSGRLLAQAQSLTTVSTDVMDGYGRALELAMSKLPVDVAVVQQRAASSAGGGLRVAAVGLIEDLTAAAARQAALNAGARIDLVLCGRLGETDLAELRRVDPEVVLFAGGTDGGQETLVRQNARVLAEAGIGAFVIVACNNVISGSVAAELRSSGVGAEAVSNVMPAIGELDVEPARRALSRVFLSHVIQGKGLSRSDDFGAMVAMPTPEAVLVATQLISRSLGRAENAGDVVVVDIGGATTDVHSAVGRVNPAGLDEALLPMLPVVRTVEGDIGMRYGSLGALRADLEWWQEQTGLEDPVAELTPLVGDPAFIPTDDRERRVDRLLAASCATVALRRHCGQLVTSIRPNSTPRVWADGPDLREVQLVVGTGGSLVRVESGTSSLRTALNRQEDRVLSPSNADVVLDRSYVLSAVGLLDEVDPEAAVGLLEEQVLRDAAQRG